MQHKIAALLLAPLVLSLPAHAEGQGFFSQYNIGVVYSSTTSYATITYDAPQVANLPTNCSTDHSQAASMRCTAYLAPDTSGASSFSVYLEKPFVRQGLFYFEPGFTFSTVSYTGGLGAKPSGPSAKSPSGSKGGGTSTSSTTAATSTAATQTDAPTDNQQPLTKAYLNFYGVDWQAYLRVGFTPMYFPDILLSGGVGLQTVGGEIKILKEDKTRFLLQPEAFAELELVLIRAHTGALSLFYGTDQSISTPLASQLISNNPSGSNMTNFNLGLTSGTAGVRLLFPF